MRNMPFMHHQRKQVMMIVFVSVVLVLLLASGMIVYSFSAKEKASEKLKADYEAKIKELQTQQAARNMRVVVAGRDILPGATLQIGDLQVLNISSDLAGENRITDIKQAVGKITKIAISKNTPLTASMMFEDSPVSKDLRVQEFNVIQLPTNLQKGQFVDIRINFPTGQDYIVLAKKKVKELAGTIVWFEMNENDILMASSAIIDAYMQGAKLYALPYVDPGLQEAAVANYPSNPKVLDLMESDPNILEAAKHELARQLRNRLDNDLKSMSDVEKMKVVSGSVTVQQQLQNERITTQQNNATRQSVQQQAQQQMGDPGRQVGQERQKNGQQAEKPSSPATSETVPKAPTPGSVPSANPSSDQEKPPKTDKLKDVFEQTPADGPAS